jgi:hypothetical protein
MGTAPSKRINPEKISTTLTRKILAIEKILNRSDADKEHAQHFMLPCFARTMPAIALNRKNPDHQLPFYQQYLPSCGKDGIRWRLRREIPVCKLESRRKISGNCPDLLRLKSRLACRNSSVNLEHRAVAWNGTKVGPAPCRSNVSGNKQFCR